LIEKQEKEKKNKYKEHQFSAVSFPKLLLSLLIFFYKPFNAFNVYWVRFHKIVLPNLIAKKTKALLRAYQYQD
jgi:hypothetical protein